MPKAFSKSGLFHTAPSGHPSLIGKQKFQPFLSNWVGDGSYDPDRHLTGTFVLPMIINFFGRRSWTRRSFKQPNSPGIFGSSIVLYLPHDMDSTTSLPTMAPPPGAPPGQTHRYSTHEWEMQKPTIERLYIEEQQTLSDVMSIMGQEFGFIASYEFYRSSRGIFRNWFTIQAQAV